MQTVADVGVVEEGALGQLDLGAGDVGFAGLGGEVGDQARVGRAPGLAFEGQARAWA